MYLALTALLWQVSPMNAGLAIQATIDLAALPLGRFGRADRLDPGGLLVGGLLLRNLTHDGRRRLGVESLARPGTRRGRS
ncbi:hypothetical protein GCM10023088_08890 [Actinomadura verrucosospora]